MTLREGFWHASPIFKAGATKGLRTVMRRLLASLVAAQLSGCATAYTVSPRLERDMCLYPAANPDPMVRVYSGTEFDGFCLAHPSEAWPFCLVDLPLSIAADTVILPYTVVRQIRDGNHRADRVECYRMIMGHPPAGDGGAP